MLLENAEFVSIIRCSRLALSPLLIMQVLVDGSFTHWTGPVELLSSLSFWVFLKKAALLLVVVDLFILGGEAGNDCLSLTV